MIWSGARNDIKTDLEEKEPATWRIEGSRNKRDALQPWRVSGNAREEVCTPIYLDFYRQFVEKEGSTVDSGLVCSMLPRLLLLTYPTLFLNASDGCY